MNLRVKDINTLQSVFRNFPAVQEVKVFGSRASGTARRASDLDLGINAPFATPSVWADLCEAMEQAPLIYELDIVRIDHTLNSQLKAKIKHEGIVVYSAKSVFSLHTDPASGE